ncbi:spore coat protein CotJB [Clostridium sp. MSJ-11]|uniref:Spore coat protein CotJB n=1 Tax=Clostridium mobile TaxID=2841512 RepID=A0ABS6EPM2_9CLOT|nr:spore coat protein CotJB [Clostridium mobile]MBU5486340.1 spore coat protein CotJB [Clostridium mobile]
MDKCEKKSSDRSQMLNKIRELEFAAVELNLFLDNNPNNQHALADYNCVTANLMKLKRKFEMEYGPLTNFGYAQSKCPWRWVEDPWPWEIDG